MTDNMERASGFIRDLGEAARRNPVSAALIGMGAVWLFASRSRYGEDIIRRSGLDRLPDAARDAWEGTRASVRPERAQQVVSEAADAVRSGGEQVANKVADAGRRFARATAEYADDLPDRAGNLLGDLRGNLGNLVTEQPLAIGVVGLAIGAAVAASLPTTEAEAEYLGESSDFIKDKVSELASEQLSRATEIGEKVADAVADEARRQGLTGEGVKSAAQDLSNKAARVAAAATTNSRSS